jgi:N-glycosidase YbiA
MKTIGQFTGQHRFLSNFWSCCIAFEGHSYRTVEHAFQAAKTLDEDERRRIRNEHSAAAAKRRGKRVELRTDWDEVKVDIMRELLRQKFGSEPLRSRLLKTGNALLVEGNWWGDKFWGVCDGKGLNTLGTLLMQIREELKEQRE